MAPRRAFCLTLELQADTREDMVNALINMAGEIDREELTTGVSGGYSSGAIYELLVNPEQTHAAWFQHLLASLDEAKRKREAMAA